MKIPIELLHGIGVKPTYVYLNFDISKSIDYRREIGIANIEGHFNNEFYLFWIEGDPK